MHRLLDAQPSASKGPTWKALHSSSMAAPRLTNLLHRVRLFLMTPNSSLLDLSTLVCCASSMGCQVSSRSSCSSVSRSCRSSASTYTLQDRSSNVGCLSQQYKAASPKLMCTGGRGVMLVLHSGF